MIDIITDEVINVGNLKYLLDSIKKEKLGIDHLLHIPYSTNGKDLHKMLGFFSAHVNWKTYLVNHGFKKYEKIIELSSKEQILFCRHNTVFYRNTIKNLIHKGKEENVTVEVFSMDSPMANADKYNVYIDIFDIDLALRNHYQTRSKTSSNDPVVFCGKNIVTDIKDCRIIDGCCFLIKQPFSQDELNPEEIFFESSTIQRMISILDN